VLENIRNKIQVTNIYWTPPSKNCAVDIYSSSHLTLFKDMLGGSGWLKSFLFAHLGFLFFEGFCLFVCFCIGSLHQ